ncbi:hypothetical protein BDQ17DRAFT_1436060 [Cyathus striatus]|nr:hypothetical protein BDQ17DRAFT_1436060 [Cyathus striatus]
MESYYAGTSQFTFDLQSQLDFRDDDVGDEGGGEIMGVGEEMDDFTTPTLKQHLPATTIVPFKCHCVSAGAQVIMNTGKQLSNFNSAIEHMLTQPLPTSPSPSMPPPSPSLCIPTMPLSPLANSGSDFPLTDTLQKTPHCKMKAMCISQNQEEWMTPTQKALFMLRSRSFI